MAVHMEAINHCLLSRRAAEYVEANQIGDAVSIPGRRNRYILSTKREGETDATYQRRDCRGGRV